MANEVHILRRALISQEIKKSLTIELSIVKDGKFSLYRGATLICGIHTLARILTYSRQLTYALTSWNTRNENSFDHALCGPFNKLRSAGSQPPGSL